MWWLSGPAAFTITGKKQRIESPTWVKEIAKRPLPCDA